MTEKKPAVGISPIDGMKRTEDDERRLNSIFAAKFNDDAGRQIIEYLRSISINFVQGPGYDPKHLPHLEGQRFHQSIIERRIEYGRQRR